MALVFPGSLRITPAANEILAAFWSEPGERDRGNLYEEYSLEALNLEKTTISRKHGHLTLYGIGKRSRLSSLVHCCRSKQQQRLWDSLFLHARDGSTLPLAECLISAFQDGVNEPEPLLTGLLEKRWGALSPEVSNKVHLALTFGRLAQVLLDCFDRAYGYIDQHGWVAEFQAVAEASFPKNELNELRLACLAVLETRDAVRFRQLQYHGPELLLLLNQLANSDTNDCLEHLLAFHRGIQRTRRGGGAWVRKEQKMLILQVAGYNGYKSDPGFPSFKLNVVIQLLTDLGRLK